MDGLRMRSCISSGSLLALFLQGWGTREDLGGKSSWGPVLSSRAAAKMVWPGRGWQG